MVFLLRLYMFFPSGRKENSPFAVLFDIHAIHQPLLQFSFSQLLYHTINLLQNMARL